MREMGEFPHEVRTIEHLFVQMPDGARLSARIWPPEDAERNPVTGTLEYQLYRKRDLIGVRDAINQPYLAGHGYTCVRVDMRGSGEANGVLIEG